MLVTTSGPKKENNHKWDFDKQDKPGTIYLPTEELEQLFANKYC